jgi:asparagine synthase (glutamine-hydrolysing)
MFLNLPVRIETSEILLVAAAGTACLRGSHAVLVGQMFTAAGERLGSLPESLSRALNSVELRQDLRGHWGNFALFLARDHEAWVYRDPSASVPVHRCGGPDETIFVSDAEFASRLCLLLRPAIDDIFVIHWLQFPFLRTRRTGLRGVTELPAGALLTRSGNGDWNESQLWHPSGFVGRNCAIDDAPEAATRVRETALATVAAQRGSRDMMLRLSGGLDSAIIAVCLSMNGADFSSINFATRSHDGDERSYAHDVAAKCGSRLVEVAEPDLARGLLPPARASFRPSINPLLAPFETSLARVAGELGASLLVDGAGGDNLFCSLSSAAPVVDAIRTGRLHDAVTAVGDIAGRANCTLWEVLRAASRSLWSRPGPWKEDRSYLVPERLLKLPELHPWLEHLSVPPGKRQHVESLVHIQHFLDRSGSPIELLHPLLAQPLLELCLRIPTWLWVKGGRDRAIARRAFTGLVPSSVLQRRMKGSLQSMLYRSFEQLREEMLALLLAGELARSGFVDVRAIERAMAGDEWMTDEFQLRISEMVALELWLQSWRSNFSGASIGS